MLYFGISLLVLIAICAIGFICAYFEKKQEHPPKSGSNAHTKIEDWTVKDRIEQSNHWNSSFLHPYGFHSDGTPKTYKDTKKWFS